MDLIKFSIFLPPLWEISNTCSCSWVFPNPETWVTEKIAPIVKAPVQTHVTRWKNKISLLDFKIQAFISRFVYAKTAVKILLVKSTSQFIYLCIFLFWGGLCWYWDGDNIKKWVKKYLAPNGPCQTVPFC